RSSVQSSACPIHGSSNTPCCDSSSEERSARNPHATFCGSRRWVTAVGDPVLAGAIPPGYPAEAHNGAGSNTVTLSRPKGESNREHKADLHTEGVLSTRPIGQRHIPPMNSIGVWEID